MLYIFIALFIFGILIATHEFGHFAAAKLLGVRVNEFAVGMGPAILQKEKGETLYSLRALPVGGYCAMEGEDDTSADPRSFGRAAGWKKLIIMSAGALVNFLTGLLILLVLYTQAQGFWMPAIGGFLEGYGLENCGLQAGDVVISIDGHRMYSYNNFSLFLSRAGDTVDLVVERDGVELTLNDLYMPYQERTDEEGNLTRLRGLSISQELLPATFTTRIQHSWYGALDFVRLVWISLGDLVSGVVGVQDLSGPVGIVDTMSQVGSQSGSAPMAAMNLAYLAALIAVNLAVMNLLPLPALDGGRIFFLLLNGLLYLLFRRKIPQKYEAYVHMAGLFALMALMVFITLSDVGKLIS